MKDERFRSDHLQWYREETMTNSWQKNNNRYLMSKPENKKKLHPISNVSNRTSVEQKHR